MDRKKTHLYNEMSTVLSLWLFYYFYMLIFYYMMLYFYNKKIKNGGNGNDILIFISLITGNISFLRMFISICNIFWLNNSFEGEG